jgi:hypothetical protein
LKAVGSVSSSLALLRSRGSLAATTRRTFHSSISLAAPFGKRRRHSGGPDVSEIHRPPQAQPEPTKANQHRHPKPTRARPSHATRHWIRLASLRALFVRSRQANPIAPPPPPALPHSSILKQQDPGTPCDLQSAICVYTASAASATSATSAASATHYALYLRTHARSHAGQQAACACGATPYPCRVTERQGRDPAKNRASTPSCYTVRRSPRAPGDLHTHSSRSPSPQSLHTEKSIISNFVQRLD